MHELNRLVSRQRRFRVAAAVALFLGLLVPAVAQQAPGTIRLAPDDADRGLSGPQHNFDFLAPGASGNEYQTAGFFGQRLRPYLARNAEAVAHLDDYRRQKILFLIDRLVALGSFGFYGQQILAGDKRQYFNNNQKVALGIFASSVLATVFINRRTNAHLLRAVKSYNEGLAHGGPRLRLRPAAIGVGASATGQPLLTLRWAVR
ncbi:hypothetical protein [Hymenobacter sp.]|uniref:hypothetical protein n=1 Tax=Hymenobacter sp. TaxID=1898978 RepID=UPI00286CBDD6|nr:hypothetical protein [Hymenobacter sp.]